jgi:KaiC/GvpD/RAD55 family RecA-like ATPase
MNKIKTHISKAYWCTSRDKICRYESSEFSFGDAGEGQAISWFDELLEGGIELFTPDIFMGKKKDQKIMPITFLITGPPGSGKTTFAIELCYRMAIEGNKLSHYISTESESYKLIENAVSFGYKHANQIIVNDFSSIDTNIGAKASFVIVSGKEEFRAKETSKFTDILTLALEAAVTKLSAPGIYAKLLNIVKQKDIDKIKSFSPDILVIDSLNIIDKEERKDFFEKLLTTPYGGSGLLICILDDPSLDKDYSSWTHVCDIVVDLNYSNVKEYYLRTLEIVKARYQSHTWGKHQMKIYSKNLVKLPDKVTKENEEKRIGYNQNLRRDHPYREEGGIFIYPSVHYFLSKYKRIAHKKLPEPVSTVPKSLDKIMQFPYGRCSAMFGCRGSHKSHLAFLNLLHAIYSNSEKGIVISLRDDEEMTKRTMSKILLREFTNNLNIPSEDKLPKDLDERENKSLEIALASLNNKIDENRFEILYFHPGYITPEEFFHRIFMSIQKMKREPNSKLTVIFNSLDQLSARFPLCANQEIFIPSIVTALSGEDVTSLFIAVDEPGQPQELYGLLPLADLVLSFYRHIFKFNDYFKHLEYSWSDKQSDEFIKKCESIKTDMKNAKIEAVVMEIVRFAGGRRAGARGLLELVHRHEIHEALYERPGLHFTELSKKVDHGDPIGTYRFPRA